MGGLYERGGMWYTRYYYRGELDRESSGSRIKVGSPGPPQETDL